MGDTNRKHYAASFKSKVALEALKGEQTLSELAAKYGVGQTQISTWKHQAIKGMADLFLGNTPKSSRSHEHHTKELHAKIGQLTLERDFLEQASRL